MQSPGLLSTWEATVYASPVNTIVSANGWSLSCRYLDSGECATAAPASKCVNSRWARSWKRWKRRKPESMVISS